MFSFHCTWTNSWANDGDAGDLRRHRAHYDVIVMNPSEISSHVHMGCIEHMQQINFMSMYDDRRVTKSVKIKSILCDISWHVFILLDCLTFQLTTRIVMVGQWPGSSPAWGQSAALACCGNLHKKPLWRLQRLWSLVTFGCTQVPMEIWPLANNEVSYQL